MNCAKNIEASLRMRKRKTPGTKKTADKIAEESVAASSGRKWYILIVCLVAMCLGIYFIAPRNYKRTPLKYQQEAGTSSEASVKDQGVSSCEDLLAAAKGLIDTDEERNIDPALDHVANCLVQEPNSTAAMWVLVFILLKADRVDDAIIFIDNALTLEPNNKKYHRSAGVLFYDFARHRETVLTLEKYFELLLGVPSWPHLLARLQSQREDEWSFLLDTEEKDNIIDIFVRLLTSYLQEKLILKATYLYKIVIGLKGISNSKELLSPYAFLSLGIADIATGIKYLRHDMEVKYVDQGYGNEEYGYEVVTAHSLRLLTAGFDADIVNMARHLLMIGDAVWEEYEYNCQLTEADKIDYEIAIMQSDIRRIFALCLARQGIITRLINEQAVVYAENRFGWTPLLNIASLGSAAVLSELMPYLEDGPQSRTALGHTSLHIAAMKGNYDIVQLLINAGLSPEEKDFRRKTAMDVACAHHWTAEKFAATLGKSLPHDCLKKIPYHLPEKHSQGGWNDSPFELPTSLTEDKCGFDVVKDIDGDDFLYEYLTLQRPVIVRDAMKSKGIKNLLRKWQRDQFVKEYGKLIFKEVAVPYVETFGYGNSTNKSTNLKDFVAKMDKLFQMGVNGYPSQPFYIFGAIQHDSPLLDEFILPSILDPELTHVSISQIQFYIGPALSGAPSHFHSNGWNILIYGKKRWFLYPPTEAFYSRQHVWSWWRQQPKPTGAMECIQYPGDLVFVPDLWGHAVLNLRESVGLAAEFIYGASEFSL